MATIPAKTYFAVKVIAPRVSDVRSTASAVPETSGPTKSACEYASTPGGASGQLVIGHADPKRYTHGVAGHLVSVLHHFSDKDSAACKNTAEAEQLMKRKHKKWLADAYDWFVYSAHFEASGAEGRGAGKAKRIAKK
jgi:hypothetical protein